MEYVTTSCKASVCVCACVCLTYDSSTVSRGSGCDISWSWLAWSLLRRIMSHKVWDALDCLCERNTKAYKLSISEGQQQYSLSHKWVTHLSKNTWDVILPLHLSQGEWALRASVQASLHLATVGKNIILELQTISLIYVYKYEMWVNLFHTVSVSSRSGGGSTQLISLRSTSIMADVSICFRTRERNPSFRRRKLSTWAKQRKHHKHNTENKCPGTK